MLARQKDQLVYDDFDITRKSRDLSSVPGLTAAAEDPSPDAD
jgi:hypothetical protein